MITILASSTYSTLVEHAYDLSYAINQTDQSKYRFLIIFNLITKQYVEGIHLVTLSSLIHNET